VGRGRGVQPLGVREPVPGCPLHGTSLQVQEAHLHGELAGAALHHDPGAEGVALRGVAGDHVGRHQHAPLEADLVLGRGGAVGIEHVALVEHGVGERARRSEAVLVWVFSHGRIP
jgi:hypothetical protein